MKKVSIIAPVFENINKINDTIIGLVDFFDGRYDFEVFYYHTKPIPENLTNDAHFKFIKVDKKKSHDDCVTDGFKLAKGDCVIVADLNNAEYRGYLKELLVQWEKDAQIVLLKQNETNLTFWQKIGRFFRNIGYKISDMFTSFANLSKDYRAMRTFQLFARNAVEVINEFPEKNYYLRNFDCWVDFRVSVIYIRQKLKVKRKQKKLTPSFWTFISSFLLMIGLVLTTILVAKSVNEANRAMFVTLGSGLSILLATIGLFAFYHYVVYRKTNFNAKQANQSRQ